MTPKAFFRLPDGELIELLEDKLVTREAWMQTIRVAPLICQVLKAKWGLARIERANPLLVQTLDVVGDLLRQPCRRSHAHSAAIASTSRNLGEPKLLCTRSDVHVKAWAVGD